jgi:hypothetical protein
MRRDRALLLPSKVEGVEAARRARRVPEGQRRPELIAQLVHESVGLAFVVFVIVFGEGAGAAAAIQSDALLLPPPPPPPPLPSALCGSTVVSVFYATLSMRRVSDEKRGTPPPSPAVLPNVPRR